LGIQNRQGGAGLETYIVRKLTVIEVENMTDDVLSAVENDDSSIGYIVDQSSLVQLVLNYLKSCSVNAWNEEDPPRRDNNDLEIIFHNAGLERVIAKVAMIMSINRGPWGGLDWLRQKTSAGVGEPQ
jgi:hypothetical protein